MYHQMIGKTVSQAEQLEIKMKENEAERNERNEFK